MPVYISKQAVGIYIGNNVRSFIMVTFQLILITQVVSVLQVKLELNEEKKHQEKRYI